MESRSFNQLIHVASRDGLPSTQINSLKAMPEKTLDLNSGEENTSSGNGQPGKNAPESDASLDELDTEIDNILKPEDEGGEDDEDDEDGDDTVVLSKREVEKLKRDNKNYRDGLISTKNKIKGLRNKSGNVEQPAKPTTQKQGSDNEPVTKAEQYQTNSRTAIDDICAGEMPDGKKDAELGKDINDNWAEVVKYYTPRRGKMTSKAIMQDILDAHTLYRKHNPKASSEGGDREAEAELGNENGKPTGQSGEGGKPKERKHVLPQKTSVQDWY